MLEHQNSYSPNSLLSARFLGFRQVIGSIVTAAVAVSSLSIVYGRSFEEHPGTEQLAFGMSLTETNEVEPIDSLLAKHTVVNLNDPLIPHFNDESTPDNFDRPATRQEAEWWRQQNLARELGLTVYDTRKEQQDLWKLLETPDLAAGKLSNAIAQEVMRRYGLNLHIPAYESTSTPDNAAPNSALTPMQESVLFTMPTLIQWLQNKPVELFDKLGVKSITLAAVQDTKIAQSVFMNEEILFDPSKSMSLDIDEVGASLDHELAHFAHLRNRVFPFDMMNDSEYIGLNPSGFEYGNDRPLDPSLKYLKTSSNNAQDLTTKLDTIALEKVKSTTERAAKLQTVRKLVMSTVLVKPHSKTNVAEDVATAGGLLFDPRQYTLIKTITGSPLYNKITLQAQRLGKIDKRLLDYFVGLGTTTYKS